jgi:hypothetical protein
MHMSLPPAATQLSEYVGGLRENSERVQVDGGKERVSM